MSAVLTIALPVFAVIAAGIFAGRAKLLSLSESDALNKFVFRFAMPCALFGLTAGASPPDAKDLAVGLSYGAGALASLTFGYVLSQRLFGVTKQEAGAHALSSTLGNAVFLGLPIALTIDGWARPFVSAMLIEGTIIIAILTALISPRKEDGHAIERALSFILGPLKNPLIMGMILGFIYSALGIHFEGPVRTFFDLLGRAAGPTALFSLGVFLATHQFPAFQSVAGRVSLIAFGKMALLPAVALTTAHFLGVSDPDYWGALALFVAVPSGVGTFVMASQYRVYMSESAAAVSFTTIISIFTISAVLVAFG
ncbi:AEC family transporter [Marinicaulis aureus]|uniref:AEC family transporter n=1 Tax=Hyphococcus aureus TaxID=2666033 RepID=A0ABW1KR77_9PROT